MLFHSVTFAASFSSPLSHILAREQEKDRDRRRFRGTNSTPTNAADGRMCVTRASCCRQLQTVFREIARLLSESSSRERLYNR